MRAYAKLNRWPGSQIKLPINCWACVFFSFLKANEPFCSLIFPNKCSCNKYERNGSRTRGTSKKTEIRNLLLTRHGHGSWARFYEQRSSISGTTSGQYLVSQSQGQTGHKVSQWFGFHPGTPQVELAPYGDLQEVATMPYLPSTWASVSPPGYYKYGTHIPVRMLLGSSGEEGMRVHNAVRQPHLFFFSPKNFW